MQAILIRVSLVLSHILQPIHESHRYICINMLGNKDLLLKCF